MRGLQVAVSERQAASRVHAEARGALSNAELVREEAVAVMARAEARERRWGGVGGGRRVWRGEESCGCFRFTGARESREGGGRVRRADKGKGKWEEYGGRGRCDNIAY